ncbi:MAG TPA: YaiO family outer membrane beta-barrel protein [Stellaceae bacterium]|nr:YaiO family outer membrane beta-barrel protein [Stellaceae bacterium]
MLAVLVVARAVALAFSLILISGLFVKARAEVSAETLYRDGVAAKTAGDFATAERDLEAARRTEPENADVLLQLGLVLGFTHHYGEARTVLEQGLRIAPSYVDLRLGLARVKSFSGDFGSAEADVDRVLAQQPDNEQALALAGRIAFYRKDLALARQRFAAALAKAPNDPDVLMGLGDVRSAEGDDAGARALYRRALAQAPNSEELAERLARPPHTLYRWQLDASFAYTALSREPQKDWKESFDQLNYHLSAATTLHGRIEESERFGQYDTYLEAGIDQRFGDGATGYVYAGGTPVAHFRERVTGMTGGTLRLTRGGDAVGTTLATIDGKFSSYSSGDVETVKPGLQQFLFSNRLWATAQAIVTRDENGHFLQGWLAKLDGTATDRLHLYVGVSSAPETSDDVTAETRSAFGGAIYDLTDALALRIDYVHEDRRHSYIRNAAVLGISVKF